MTRYLPRRARTTQSSRLHLHQPHTFDKKVLACQLLAIIMAGLYMELSFGFMSAIPIIVIAGFVGFCLLGASLAGRFRVDPFCLLFLCVVPITIYLAEPRPLFRSWERFAIFALVFSVVSPFLTNGYFRTIRRTALIVVLLIASVLGILSFFAYFLGINYMVYDEENIYDFVNLAGRFGGFTRHSMMLGPISGLGALATLYLFFSRRQWLWLFPAIVCVATILFSASRSAFIAFLGGAFVLVFSFIRNLKHFAHILFVLLALLFVSGPFWQAAMSGIAQKQEYHQEEGEVFDSRTDKFECRINEFMSSPIWGVGFGAIDPRLKDNYGSNGTIEPGSSWLAVLSMTGLVGFSLVIMMFWRSLLSLWRQRSGFNVLVLSCLVLFCIHMIAEGYVFASGNPMCFICWLLVGLGADARRPRPTLPVSHLRNLRSRS